jgi:putative radical SAM enzyme (TIGR03279 family)
MSLFLELADGTFSGGVISAVEPGSVAASIGLRPQDELLAVNGNPVQDVIDVHFYGAEEELELTVRRGDERLQFNTVREYNRPLGLQFTHPTFDTDIRRCNNLCEFCFVLQMAPRFRRTLYIKDDDYRYSFLHGHYVTLTNLSDHDWWRIETMRLSPLYVSVHVTDLEMRRRFLRNAGAPDIMLQLRRLSSIGVEIHTQLVIVPGFNDGQWIEQSIEELAALWPSVASISIVPVGLTKHHKYKMRPHTAKEAASILEYLHSIQSDFLEQIGIRLVYPTDEWYLVAGQTVPALDAYDGQQLHENGLGLVRRFLDEWLSVRDELLSARRLDSSIREMTLVTGTLFAPVLQNTVAEFSQLSDVRMTVLPVVNRHLGDTITAAGLLMGEDIMAEVVKEGVAGVLLLPRVTFDHPDTITLDDLSPQAFADRLKCPVALVESMGDVLDVLLGRSRLRFEPQHETV